MANSVLGENAHIRIMPDAHAGAGCTIGTTMVITDKICPNLVGVDIGCGVDLVHTDIDFSSRLDELDQVIHKYVPSGFDVQLDDKNKFGAFEGMYCWKALSPESRAKALLSAGTLGGGNHFIEAYKDGWLAVHSGSRNIGLSVANYYQKVAEMNDYVKIDKDLKFLTGLTSATYVYDAGVMAHFAEYNRSQMLKVIVEHMKGTIGEQITSTHNYIGLDNILRKGAIRADKGMKLVIPLNMRDGMLVCVGKGNEDWNNSAPHGAGRI
jgi:RNA-splicing ligase RtcB